MNPQKEPKIIKIKLSNLIAISIVIAVIIIICFIAFAQYIKNASNEPIQPLTANNNTTDKVDTNNNATKNNNNTTDINDNKKDIKQYESAIIDKWKATLPLNSTNGLLSASYCISQNILYLKYTYGAGICVVDANNEINRYMEGDNNYISAQNNIENAQKGSLDYIYLTATEFEDTIKDIEASKTNTQETENNTNPLVGRHRVVYVAGTDLSNISGYLELKANNEFKMYVNFPTINMELENIEGTYSIYGDTITINITREGGFDLGSQSRQDTITIAEDNLAYSTMKFAK